MAVNVNLHARGRAYPLRSTMSAIELKLDPTRFVRTLTPCGLDTSIESGTQPVGPALLASCTLERHPIPNLGAVHSQGAIVVEHESVEA